MTLRFTWTAAVTLLTVVASIVAIIAAPPLVRLIALLTLGAIIGALLLPDLARRLRGAKTVSMDFLPEAPYRVLPATEDDIRWAAETARQVYSGIDVIPPSLMREWFKANPTGFSVIKDRHGHRCGNLDILPLKADTLERFLAGELIEREIRGDSIYSADEARGITALYVESLVAISQGNKGNPMAAYKCIMTAPEMLARICPERQIRAVYAIGASPCGVRFLTALGFDRMQYETKRRDGHQMFAVSFLDLVRNIATYADASDKARVLAMLKSCGEEGTM